LALRVITFTRAGRFLIKPSAIYGNLIWRASPIAVTVGSGVGEDFQLRTWMRTDEIYLSGGRDEGFFCDAWVDGVKLRPGEEPTWTLIPDDPEGEAPVTLYIDSEEQTSATICYQDIKALGEAGYTLRYSALDGLYEKETHVTIKVTEKPDSAPTGVSYTPAALTLTEGDSYTFREDEILFTGGTLDKSVKFWHEFWPSDNIWDHCDYDEIEDGVIQVTFRDPGRYVMTAAGGYGSCEFTREIPVLVKPAGGKSFQLEVFQRYPVLYVDGYDECYNVGGVSMVNFQPIDGEETRWSIERTDENGGNPVELYFGSESQDFASIDYRFGSGGGSVVYRITCTAGEGENAYTAYADYAVTVVEKKPDNLPAGIETPFDGTYDLTVGDTLSFDPGDIQFAQEGDLPQGLEVWRNIWTDEGNWDDVERNWDDDPVYTYTRPVLAQGRHRRCQQHVHAVDRRPRERQKRQHHAPRGISAVHEAVRKRR
jgi:hypothetical protein